MGIKAGLVGLPNVGKSTLFNALTKSNIAAANFPFCTIEPNVAVTPVPDMRLSKLAKVFSSAKVIPNMVEFVDIAGLVRGASKGEGLGNKFLSHIAQVDLIINVARCFEDGNIIHVDDHLNPLEDLNTILSELFLKDLESLEKRELKAAQLLKKCRDKTEQAKLEAEQKFNTELQNAITQEDQKLVQSLASQAIEQGVELIPLLTAKKFLVVANLPEAEMSGGDYKNNQHYQALVQKYGSDAVIPVSAQIEAELSQLSPEEQQDMRQSLEMEQAGLNSLINQAYKNLGLISFFTCGPKEAHAWSVQEGASAPEAAGQIHTDLQRGFICAEVYNFTDIQELGTESAVRNAGKVRTEGKDYIIQDGDVINIKFNV